MDEVKVVVISRGECWRIVGEIYRLKVKAVVSNGGDKDVFAFCWGRSLS